MLHIRRALYWGIPPLVCLLLYWNGLRAWFQQDDFAWLLLHQRINDFSSFMTVMFKPYAQGTVRPLSERLFFLVFFSVFGMEALPFRIFVFLTQFGALAMMTLVTRRLTGLALAGFFAPILWVCNSSQAVPMSWTAAYNPVLCSFFLLLALYLFMRFTDSGDKRFYAAQWLVFLLGFGVLELNVVYPAIALLYVWCARRPYWKYTLPMFAASIVYTIVHRIFSTKTPGETYTMFFDGSMFVTLWTYVRWSLGGERLAKAFGIPIWPYQLAELAVGMALLVFIVVKLRERNWIPIFCIGWFLGVIAPLLPLKNHVSNYYPMIPAIGLAILGGWALAAGLRRSKPVALIAIICAIAYAGPSAWASYHDTEYAFHHSRNVRSFLKRLARASELHPHKTLLITGVDNDLFWNGYYGYPYRIFGRENIYLTEPTEYRVVPFPEIGSISQFFLPDSVALHALDTGKAVVYEVVDNNLRNVTSLYHRMLRMKELGQPARVEVGSALFDGQLGDGWQVAEDGFRWMKKRGIVYLRGPEAGEKLSINGDALPLPLKDGPLRLTVSVNGRVVGTDEINLNNLVFSFKYDLPPEVLGVKRLEVAIEADRTFTTPDDGRVMSVTFGAVELAK